MPTDQGALTFQETLAKLHARLLDAKKVDLGNDNPQEFALGMMQQLMSEAERQRQACLKQVQDHREQARAAEYQASAYATINSMAWAIFDGYVRQEERAIQERKDREAEKKEAADAIPEVKNGAAEVKNVAAAIGSPEEPPAKKKKR
jgi:DNA replication protein DnaC